MDKTSLVVVADAGPIIQLDELACLDLLVDFGRVIVPETVWLEVQCHRPLALESAVALFVRQRSATGFVTPSLMFCAKLRHPTLHKTLRTGLQIPSGFVNIAL